MFCRSRRSSSHSALVLPKIVRTPATAKMTMELPPQVQPYVDKVDAFMAKYPSVTQYDLLKKAETETGVPKVFFFILAVFLLAGMTVAVGGLKFVVDLLGFLYPAYMSFKSLEASNKDDTQWLTYWVVFSFFSILENVFGFVVAMIPFYYFIKAGTIVWLYHPKTMGAKGVYEQGLRPLLLPYIETTTTKKSE